MHEGRKGIRECTCVCACVNARVAQGGRIGEGRWSGEKGNRNGESFLVKVQTQQKMKGLWAEVRVTV